MSIYSEKDFSKIVKKNAQSQRHDLLVNQTDVMRVYDRNLKDFPVTVDLYADYARIVDYGEVPLSDAMRDTCIDLVSRFAYVDKGKVVYSYREKLEKGKQHEKTEAEPLLIDVHENGLVFKVNLSSYTDTGLFLDHINTRSFIREYSAGKDVLNLFSYTGSFSVYAASGMAKSVTSVDLSNPYTKRAEENLSANGFEGKNYECVCEDAGKFIDEKLKSNERYDIIIFDPPSFSNSRKMEHDFDVQRDFSVWIRKLVGLLRKGGFILFSTNLSSFKMDRRRLRGLNVKEITAKMWAEGFVKGRKGTVRSWLMSMDDDSLSLDWSEDVRPSEKRREGRRNVEHRDRRSPRNFDSHRGRRSERNRMDDRDNHGFEKRERYGRSEDRRRFDNRKYPEERRFGRRFEDRDNRFDNDRFGYDRFERKDRRTSYGDREGREYSDFRERRDYRSSREPERRERRSFSDRDRVRRDIGRERSEYRRPEGGRSARRDKPYGFESFKPARNRNDSSDFFWNSDDIKREK